MLMDKLWHYKRSCLWE